ncbi:hypothetical protein RHMOL_Rhmol02G0053000 [Rhododendron molle]|uniref:Uncharacterized protein n=1 Tax=Rhododendron molle TaxID=49168 RepID=A0ACC0PN93_RHOML|nr:hypothetical protein RHMOL_Rhmol02G0053000 [Rhododendron molle]
MHFDGVGSGVAQYRGVFDEEAGAFGSWKAADHWNDGVVGGSICGGFDVNGSGSSRTKKVGGSGGNISGGDGGLFVKRAPPPFVKKLFHLVTDPNAEF